MLHIWLQYFENQASTLNAVDYGFRSRLTYTRDLLRDCFDFLQVSKLIRGALGTLALRKYVGKNRTIFNEANKI